MSRRPRHKGTELQFDCSELFHIETESGDSFSLHAEWTEVGTAHPNGNNPSDCWNEWLPILISIPDLKQCGNEAVQDEVRTAVREAVQASCEEYHK